MTRLVRLRPVEPFLKVRVPPQARTVGAITGS
jgi:hypothetical protein